MRALVAILTAGVGMIKGEIGPQEYADTIAPIIGETWPVEPLECIPALSALALRLASLLAEARELDGVEAVLSLLGAEVAGGTTGAP